MIPVLTFGIWKTTGTVSLQNKTKIKNKGLIPETKATKAKIIIWNYINLNSYCAAKETVNKMKRQPKECEKIFANYMSDEG